MAAETIATLDRVCVHYRQRRQGNILGTTSRCHFDVFDQYDRVFAFVDAHPELDQWRPVLFRRMVDHLATVFTKPDRLPRGTRAEFLRKARAHYRRYRIPGTPVPVRTRLRHTLVHFGVHRTFRALQAAMSWRRSAVKLTAKALRARSGRPSSSSTTGPTPAPAKESRGVRRLLGTRPQLQPGRAGDGVPHPRPAHPHRVDRPPRAPPHDPGRDAQAAPQHGRLLDGVGPLQVPGEQRQLRPPTGQAPRPGHDPDPTRHPAQAHGPRPPGTPGGRTGHGLRRTPQGRRQVGPRPVPQPPHHPDLGAGLPRQLHHARLRLSPQRRVPAGDFGRRAPPARVARHPAGRDRPPLRADPPRLPPHPARPLDLDRVLRRLGPRFVVLARAHYWHEGPLAPPRPAGSSTSPTTPASSRSASPRTRWSPTTRP
jgi:hypothetical protein